MKSQNVKARRRGKFLLAFSVGGAALCASLLSLTPATVLAGTTSYQYDTLGRVVKVTYPDAKQICYTYDAAGNRTQVKRQATGTCTVTGSTLTTSSLTTETTSEAATVSQSEELAVASESSAPSEEQ